LIDYFTIVLRLLNGTITLYFAPLLYRIYRNTGRRFYLYWSLGYGFYAVNILIRLLLPSDFSVTATGLSAFFLLMLGFTFMVVGVGELIERTRIVLASILIVPGVALLQILSGTILRNLAYTMALLPYIFMTAILLVINFKWRMDLRLLLSGWALLGIINAGLLVGLIHAGFVELTSAFGKTMIFFGMTQSNFSLIAEDLRRFLIGGLPIEYYSDFLGGFDLINLRGVQKEEEIKWITERVSLDSRRGVRTILISVFDLITPREIKVEGNDENLYFVRMISGSRSSLRAFEEQIMTINDDINNLDILLTDIIDFSNQRKIPCDIILYSLSHLIHSHGWRRVYTFLTAKISILKNSRVKLSSFYYPRTHENVSDIRKFETLADEVTGN
jgi:hypothetical protein